MSQNFFIFTFTDISEIPGHRIHIAKTTDLWAKGSRQGSLDSGAIRPHTWYDLHHIKHYQSGISDVLLTVSETDPRPPEGYAIVKKLHVLKTSANGEIRSEDFGASFGPKIGDREI